MHSCLDEFLGAVTCKHLIVKMSIDLGHSLCILCSIVAVNYYSVDDVIRWSASCFTNSIFCIYEQVSD